MKRFITKFLSFVLIFILLVTIGTFISVKLLNRSSYYKLSNRTNFIILGHSQSEVAFNDSLISGLSNFSKSGEAYFYTFLKARKIIPSNKQLKAVFIEFENSQIDKVMDSWTWGDDRLSKQFPRYFPLLKDKDLKFLWQKNSNAILSSSPKTFMEEIGFTYLSTFVIRKGIKSNNRFGGYFHLERGKKGSLMNNKLVDKVEKKTEYKISETNITYLSKLIELCIQNDVKVYLVRTPLQSNYPFLENEPEFKRILKTRFKNIDFLDFKKYPIKNSEFGDSGHLNFQGSKIFSNGFNKLLEDGLLDQRNKQAIIDKKNKK